MSPYEAESQAVSDLLSEFWPGLLYKPYITITRNELTFIEHLLCARDRDFRYLLHLIFTETQ